MIRIAVRYLGCALAVGTIGVHPVGTAASTVSVYAYDGSIQCRAPGTAPEAMAAALAQRGIEVLRACKGNDGRMRAAVCDAPTGNINVYEIDAGRLRDAQALGFSQVTEQIIDPASCTETTAAPERRR